jgi:hypothetical protein
MSECGTLGPECQVSIVAGVDKNTLASSQAAQRFAFAEHLSRSIPEGCVGGTGFYLSLSLVQGFDCAVPGDLPGAPFVKCFLSEWNNNRKSF